MKTAVELVDDLLIGPAANDAKTRQTLVILRQLLTATPPVSGAVARSGQPARGPQSPPGVGVAAPLSRGGTVTGYARSKKGDTEFLDEMRQGTNPYRTPHAEFSAAVATLSQAKRPLNFEQLRADVIRRLGLSEIKEFRLRTVVRFLLSESLIGKTGTRYHAVGSAPIFTAAANAAWAKLPVN